MHLRVLGGHGLTQLHPRPRFGQPDQALQLPRLHSIPLSAKQRQANFSSATGMAFMPQFGWHRIPRTM